jgi:hypothetical protein
MGVDFTGPHFAARTGVEIANVSKTASYPVDFTGPCVDSTGQIGVIPWTLAAHTNRRI